MKKRHLVVLLGFLVLVALPAIAGCGESEEAEAALSKKQYQKQADQICNDAGHEQFEGVIRYRKKHPGAEEEEMVAPVALPPLEKQLEELKELPMPNGDEAQLEAYFTQFAKALGAAREDPPSVLSVQENPFNPAIAIAKKYGLGDCAVAP